MAKRRGTRSKAFKYFSYVTTAVAIGMLILIIYLVFVNGIPGLSFKFLFGKYNYDAESNTESLTLLPSLIATGYIILISLVIAVPIGVFCAIYLNEYTKKNNRLVKAIRFAIDILAGLPSIIFGLFGILVFCLFFNLQASILAGALTMVFVILPFIVRSTEEALKAVPDSLREASQALGAGKLRTVFVAVLPNAIPGIIASVILSIGRLVGESAVILLTLGGVINDVPKSILSSGSTLAATLYHLANNGDSQQAYATGVVLIVIVFLLNFLAYFIERKLSKGKLINE